MQSAAENIVQILNACASLSVVGRVVTLSLLPLILLIGILIINLIILIG
jgi:hypothetical protein